MRIHFSRNVMSRQSGYTSKIAKHFYILLFVTSYVNKRSWLSLWRPDKARLVARVICIESVGGVCRHGVVRQPDGAGGGRAAERRRRRARGRRMRGAARARGRLVLPLLQRGRLLARAHAAAAARRAAARAASASASHQSRQ